MILLILALALLLRLINLNQSLWLDEAINVLAAKNYSFFGMITEYAKADFHPPGYFIILWFWARVAGISEIAVRGPSVMFGVLTIFLVYLIGQKIHSKTLGLLAATFLAINPLHIYYSQEARMYALAVLAVSLNIFLLLKFVKGEKMSLLFLIFSNLLVLASDYVAYFIFPAQFAFLLFIRNKALLKRWFVALVVAVLIGIWWLPVFISQLDIGSVASSKLPAWKLIVGAFDPKAVPLTFVKFIIGRISYPDKLIYALILLPVSILFLFLLWRGVKFKTPDKNLILSWIFVPIIMAFFISLAIPIYSYFRLLFVLPAFILLVSLGILLLGQKLKYVFLLSVILIELGSTAIYLFNPSYHRDDWKSLVNFLKSKDSAVVLFESSGTLPPFDYYAKGEINAKGGLKDFPAKDINDVADLENILLGKKEVYLAEYLVDISDPQRFIKKRLVQLNYKEAGVTDFNGVGFVYHYIK